MDFLTVLVIVFGLATSPIQGILVDQDGAPIQNTTIIFVDAGMKIQTDNDGRFMFKGTPGQYRLSVLNNVFSYNFEAESNNNIIFPTVTEVISVYPGTDEQLRLDKDSIQAGTPGNLTDVLSKKNETHQSGIGGLLSTVSVGGLSKHRVQTMINGIRVAGDRRAGSDLGTVIPDLMNNVQVFRGGTGISFGSTAIGGVIDVQMPRPAELENKSGVSFAWTDNNDRKQVSFLTTHSSFALGAAFDKAGSYQSPDGSEQDGFYSRYNVFGTWQREISDTLHKFDLFLSKAEDIGKPSSSSSTTVYPEYGLNLFGYHLTGTDFAVHFGATSQNLETKQDEERSTIESLNFHTKAFYYFHEFHFGVEVFSRQSMTAENFLEDGTYNKPLDNASSWEVAPFIALSHEFSKYVTTDIGGRFQYMTAENGHNSIDDTFFTYFGNIGLFSPLGKVDLSAFRSYRFPTLEEYFYTGLTGRGFIEGNADLKAEHGVGGRLSWRKEILGFYLFAAYQLQEVSDFIEKYEMSDDYYSYRNVGRARISDAVLNFSYNFVTLGFSWSQGEDADTNEILDDIPPWKIRVDLDPIFSKFRPRLGLMYVGAKEDIGPSEQEVKAYTLVDVAMTYSLYDWLSIGFNVNNLFNQTYLFSADEKAVDAPGRSISFILKTTF